VSGTDGARWLPRNAKSVNSQSSVVNMMVDWKQSTLLQRLRVETSCFEDYHTKVDYSFMWTIWVRVVKDDISYPYSSELQTLYKVYAVFTGFSIMCIVWIMCIIAHDSVDSSVYSSPNIVTYYFVFDVLRKDICYQLCGFRISNSLAHKAPDTAVCCGPSGQWWRNMAPLCWQREPCQ